MRFLDDKKGGEYYYPNNQGVYDSQPEFKNRHSQLMAMVMNITSVKMMIIILNNQVSYSVYNQMMRKSIFTNTANAMDG